MSGFWQAVLYLHLTAVAFFFGGQLVLGVVIVPVERSGPTPCWPTEPRRPRR